MGSEMCIRDRFLGQLEGLDVQVQRFLVVCGEQLDPAAVALAHACLLYTSDAAGERSSVDFGGRRLIKKKTTEINFIMFGSIETAHVLRI